MFCISFKISHIYTTYRYFFIDVLRGGGVGDSYTGSFRFHSQILVFGLSSLNSVEERGQVSVASV